MDHSNQLQMVWKYINASRKIMDAKSSVKNSWAKNFMKKIMKRKNMKRKKTRKNNALKKYKPKKLPTQLVSIPWKSLSDKLLKNIQKYATKIQKSFCFLWKEIYYANT